MKQLPLFPELINSKQCSTCGAVKSLAEYHKNPHTRDGYYVACKTCCAEYQREYRLKHKEELREKKRQYRENNREAVIARKKAYYKSNQRKIVRRVVQWQKDNPDKVRTKSKLRRFRERANGGEVSASEWQMLKKMFGGRCAACGQKTRLEMDHIVPVIEGGAGDITNLQPLCRSCNASKGAETIDYRPSEIRTQVEEYAHDRS